MEIIIVCVFVVICIGGVALGIYLEHGGKDDESATQTVPETVAQETTPKTTPKASYTKSKKNKKH